jgi:hypothetical protein
MTGRSGFAASALIGLMLVGTPVTSSAQQASGPAVRPVGWIAAFAPGSIHGIVRDETGIPVAGATVSAVGASTAVALTDRNGRFDLQTLSPGPYLVRAHLTGYVAPRAQVVEVRSSGRVSSSISLRRSGAPQLMTAGVGAVEAPDPQPVTETEADTAPPTPTDDHSETAWRLRHTRRGILKQATLPDLLVFSEGPSDRAMLGNALTSSVRLATNFFTNTPFSGQVNLLTSGSFNTPQQLFSSDSLPTGIAYVRVGAPAGTRADWTVRGALSQADISSWIVAGSYTTRMPARHRYDLGMSYSTQRYDGGNPFALRDVSAGSRNAGLVYGFDTFTVSPALAVTFGARYARYDYLDNRSLLSPRVEVTITPAHRWRVNAGLWRRAHAPGAEEFLPPGEHGIWLPPQRTFSSLSPRRPFEAERATHMAVAIERDLGASTVSVGAFRQHVDDQLVTLFGADVPQQHSASIGHYFVGNAGNVDAAGCTLGFRTTLASRVSGSLSYSTANARLVPGDGLRYLILVAPSAVRPVNEQLHDLSTSLETTVPETATRVVVLYRVGNAFARPAGGPDGSTRPGVDSRFDVQVHQSLPFLDFTSAKWEMLVAVRNFFRETAGPESVYDELLVVNPPKRIVGGVTMRF